MRFLRRPWPIGAGLLLVAATTAVLAVRPSSARATAAIARRPGEIELAAEVHASGFDQDFRMPGYHALVWRKGRAAHAALLRAEASDREVLAALKSIGGRPGDNLPMAAWEERKDPKSRAPDAVIGGTPITMLLRLPDRGDLVSLSDVLEDPAGRGVELRFGGNEANIPIWKSGCIVCLYSCPGSKVGNARYTVRDYEMGVTRFRMRPGALPADGTRIGVVLRLASPG